MGLMRTLAVGAVGYWLYRSGRLDPYIQQVKDSPLFRQLKDKAGMGDGSTMATPPPTTEVPTYSPEMPEPRT
jgi:hypothetical protein